jgi:hypothetical protein
MRANPELVLRMPLPSAIVLSTLIAGCGLLLAWIGLLTTTLVPAGLAVILLVEAMSIWRRQARFADGVITVVRAIRPTLRFPVTDLVAWRLLPAPFGLPMAGGGRLRVRSWWRLHHWIGFSGSHVAIRDLRTTLRLLAPEQELGAFDTQPPRQRALRAPPR